MTGPASDILIVTRHYAPEPTGSAPVMQEIAEWLAAREEAVRVVTVRPSYPGTEIYDGYRDGERDHAWESGVDVIRFPTTPLKGVGLMGRAWPETRFLLQLLAGAATGGVKPADRVISLCPSILTTLGALALVKSKGRHVAVVHDIQSGLGSALGSATLRIVLPLLRRLELFALNRVDHIVVLSDAMRDVLTGLGVARPISVLPPSIDTKRILPAHRPLNAPPTLLYSGNLGRKQGLEQLLGLADALAARAPEIKIVIRGEGAMRESLVQSARSRNLANLTFLPLAAKSMLSEALGEGDIHLVPQVARGGDFAVPSKVFAIMSAARPFVATAEANSALAKLAAESGAFVCVAPNSPAEFADAVIALLADPPRRLEMGRRGRAYVEREVDTDVVMRRLLPLLTAPTPAG
jgi:colanic acid biosynthesis glycosyl transferase WcaI